MDVDAGTFVEKQPPTPVIPTNNVEMCDTTTLRDDLIAAINGMDKDALSGDFNKNNWLMDKIAEGACMDMSPPAPAPEPSDAGG